MLLRSRIGLTAQRLVGGDAIFQKINSGLTAARYFLVLIYSIALIIAVYWASGWVQKNNVEISPVVST